MLPFTVGEDELAGGLFCSCLLRILLSTRTWSQLCSVTKKTGRQDGEKHLFLGGGERMAQLTRD